MCTQGYLKTTHPELPVSRNGCTKMGTFVFVFELWNSLQNQIETLYVIQSIRSTLIDKVIENVFKKLVMIQIGLSRFFC